MLFSFKNKEIVLKPMTTAEMEKFKEKKPKDVAENTPKSLHILTKKCFQAESIELGVIYAAVVKEVSGVHCSTKVFSDCRIKLCLPWIAEGVL
ncbi:hypothetical protein U1Q18_045311 [Sarracenia purpurea var. burkii]